MLAHRSLLVVDDDRFFVSSLVEGLLALAPSIDLCVAHDGAEALRVLAQRSFDALVTDIEMPELDGIALLEAMRERASTMPVVVVSTQERAGIAGALADADFEYLAKPLDFARLVATLIALLEHVGPEARATRRLQPPDEHIMSNNIQQSLQSIMELQGAMGTAFVDWENGMCLGTAGSGINLEIAAAGNTDVVRAKMRVMKSLGIKGAIEDMLITLTDQYHLIRPTGTSLFLYLVIDRKVGNLALARIKLSEVGRTISM